MSLLLSAMFRRTLPSTVASYGAAFASLVGTLVVGGLFTLVIWQREGTLVQTGSDVHPFVFANPLYALSWS